MQEVRDRLSCWLAATDKRESHVGYRIPRRQNRGNVSGTLLFLGCAAHIPWVRNEAWAAFAGMTRREALLPVSRETVVAASRADERRARKRKPFVLSRECGRRTKKTIPPSEIERVRGPSLVSITLLPLYFTLDVTSYFLRLARSR